MSKQITAIIVGAGHRAILYSLYALEHPDELKIVGGSDPAEKGCGDAWLRGGNVLQER